jgi:hypothetical protein
LRNSCLVRTNYIISGRLIHLYRLMSQRAAIQRSVLSLGVALLLVTVLVVYLSMPRSGGFSLVKSTGSSVSPSQSTQEVVTTILNSTVLPPSTTNPFSSTTQTSCTILFPAGENLGLFLRVVFDANQKPIVGARVEATYQVIRTPCIGSPPTITEIALAFTTSNTEWYAFDSQYSGPYSIAVSYSGHGYSLTMQGRAESAVCESLYVPSGRTNVTVVGYVSTCSSVG